MGLEKFEAIFPFEDTSIFTQEHVTEFLNDIARHWGLEPATPWKLIRGPIWEPQPYYKVDLYGVTRFIETGIHVHVYQCMAYKGSDLQYKQPAGPNQWNPLWFMEHPGKEFI